MTTKFRTRSIKIFHKILMRIKILKEFQKRKLLQNNQLKIYTYKIQKVEYNKMKIIKSKKNIKFQFKIKYKKF